MTLSCGSSTSSRTRTPDGLSASALALRARGESVDAAVLLSRGQTPFGRRPPLPAATVAVLDWGMSRRKPRWRTSESQSSPSPAGETGGSLEATQFELLLERLGLRRG